MTSAGASTDKREEGGSSRPPLDPVDLGRTRAAVLESMFGIESKHRLGRFEVAGSVGAGAMGQVFRAHDPRLGRDVAIKVVHATPGEGFDRQLRLLREAKALAALSHPNVVAVFETGFTSDGVYLVMELVDGDNLLTWREARQRTPAEILDVFVQAGEGLAAVHEAGLVHRDFKPANTVVGRDGRVRVVDFGLAHGEGLRTAPQDTRATLHDTGSRLTVTGGTVGTPAYMAPEQRWGDPGPASDQYAFCVSLLEALTNERPPKFEARVEVASQSADCPLWLRPLLVRGLQIDPDHRFPSMRTLVTQLRRGPARKRWPIAAGAAAAAAVGISWGVAAAPAGAATCDAEERLAEVWNQDRSARARSAVLATGTGYAEETWVGAARDIDAYTAAWTELYEDSCQTSDPALADRMRACLRERLTKIDAVATSLEAVNADNLEKVAAVVGSLESLTPCGDAGILVHRIPPPDDPLTAAEVGRLRTELARAKTLIKADAFAEALAVTETLIGPAEATGYRPLEAEVLATMGSALAQLVRIAPAKSTLERAFWLAQELGHDEIAAEVAVRLIDTAGELNDPEGAAVWGRHCAAAIHRYGGHPVFESRMHAALGRVQKGAGNYDVARDHYEKSIELATAALGPEHMEVGVVYSNLAGLEAMAGRAPEARAADDRAFEILESALGPTHPTVGGMHLNIGAGYMTRGELDEARRRTELGLSILTKAHGPNHQRVATGEFNLGIIEIQQGNYPAGRDRMRRALEIRDAIYGPDHAETSRPLEGLAFIAGKLGDFDRAVILLERIIATQIRTHGPDSHLLAVHYNNLAMTRLKQDDGVGAEKDARRSMKLLEDGGLTKHFLYANALHRLASALLTRDEPQQSLEYLTRAMALADELGDKNRTRSLRVSTARSYIALGRYGKAIEHLEAAIAGAGDGSGFDGIHEAKYLLAAALWKTGRERKRAVTLAREALDDLPDRAEPGLREGLELWLAAHDPSFSAEQLEGQRPQ